MKKILVLLNIVFILSSLLPKNIFAQDNEDNYFIVTAYYSPLPNQNYYLMGNYEDELILNGMGIAGASGKKVFSGMLAAPKNYQFGTKIYLEGLGVGSVEDRGGAIVNAGERGYKSDRIDVWVGYGDEGLRRALYWGKRKVKGSFLDKDTKVSIDLNNIDSPAWVTKGLDINIDTKTKKTVSKTNKGIIKNEKLNLFDKYIHPNSGVQDIKSLQDTMKSLALYSGELTGIYDDIRDELLDYQISNEIIKGEETYGAGYFGPKTREIMKKDFEIYLENEKKAKERKKYLEAKKIELGDLSIKKANNVIESIGIPVFGDIGANVRELQLVLKELGYFDYKDTAIFGEITNESIISFQISNNIITDINDTGAGVFGPKTREVLTQVLQRKYYIDLFKNEDFSEEELIYLVGEEI